MRQSSRIALLAASFLIALCASAQAPQKIPVTGNLGSITGSPTPYASVEIDLYNCPAPVSVTGYMGIIQTSYAIQADASGNVNSTIWPNNIITCNGTTGTSTYGVTYIINGVPSSSVQCYSILSGQGQWHLDGQQAPVTCGSTPPNPTTGTFGNLNSTGFFQGNNGDFTGDLAIGGNLTGTTAAFSGNVSVGSLTVANVFSCPTTSTLVSCISQLPSTGGILNLQTGTYVAGSFQPFATACMSKPNVTIFGAGTPQFNSPGTALTGGTIIQGEVGICANNFSIANLGVDVGSAFIGGGAIQEGLVLDGPNNATESPSDPILIGAAIANVVVIGPGAMQPIHAFLVEHYSGVSINNVQARLAQHCFALKSSNVTFVGFRHQQCSVDGITMKGDAYTQLSNINVSVVEGHNVNPSDTNGIGVVATESTGTVTGVTLSHIHEVGAVTGLSLTNSSGVGAGALSNVIVTDLNVKELPTGAAAPTCILTAGSSSIDKVQINNVLCDNESAQNSAPLQMNLGLTNCQLNNLTFINGGFSSDVEGFCTINNINDWGGAFANPTIFDQTSGSTVLQISGWYSNRGNSAFGTNVGATAYVQPSTQTMHLNSSSVAFTAPITATRITNTDTGVADTYNIFSNTGGGASYVQNNATVSTYAPFESVTSTACWITHTWGTTDFGIFDCQGGAPVQVVKIVQGAPLNSLTIDGDGNNSIGGGTQTVFRCATAGATLPAGSLTTVSGACGTTVDTGLRVK